MQTVDEAVSRLSLLQNKGHQKSMREQLSLKDGNNQAHTREISQLAKAGQQAMNSLQPRYDAYLKNNLPLLDSIPNFYMEEFSPASAFTKSIGVELL